MKPGADNMNKDPIILVLASRNKGKTEEIRHHLNPFPVIIKNLDDFGPLPPVIEDGITFEENAYKKASITAQMLGFPALSDDSGLLVDALNGAPGVYSARYAGESATDKENCQKLLLELGETSNRKAAFECVISIATPLGHALTYESRCEGVITHTPKGSSGFGYDPLFFFPPLDKTFAQMTMDEKNTISHRGKALMDVKKEFDKIIIWIRQHMPDETKGCGMDG